MNKYDKAYQSIIRSMPCSFCGENRHGYVSWHHLKCIGQLRSASWSTIPVCSGCHNDCHSLGLSKTIQKLMLLNTWNLIGLYIVDKAPRNISQEEWGVYGSSYWDKVIGMIDNGVIAVK